MTQLDRLEALAKSTVEQIEDGAWAEEVSPWLPDLIRVARAARNLADDLETEAEEGFWWAENYQDLENTLVPLFSEVES